MRIPCRQALFMLGAVLGSASVTIGQAPPKPALVAETEPLTPDQEKAAFHLPPGFEAQLVVSEPAINKPMNLAFDDRGRLWVTTSREYPFPAEEGAPHRDRVVVLSDFGADGRAGKVQTFADGLNIPIGVFPIGEGRRALVHGIPNIWLMTDDDGDGVADRREIAYSTYGSRDTHGMTSAFSQPFDGWIYACHGFSNTSTVHGADGQAITMNSGNVYRFRPDGSHLEQVTWGQVNPFGLAFDPMGNLYSCDCHSRPIYQLLRGAYYPSFGKPHDGLGYGPEMLRHDHGSTGIAGIVYLASESVPESFRGDILIGNPVTSRINRDRLEWRGSSPVAIEQPDFLVSDDPWFRPVDITYGPDGALYVADFYNRIIGHYEVPLTHPGRDRERGRVWRIVYKGNDAQAIPAPHGGDFTAASPEELVEALGHPNLAIRLRATNVLAAKGEEVVPIVREAIADRADAETVAHGLWVLFRLGALDEATLARSATDEEGLIRVHAQRILAESDQLDGPRRDLALAALKEDDDPLVRRCAAEVLGRHPRPENLRPLIDARQAAESSDTHLVHVIRMALRDQLRDGRAWPKSEPSASWSEADLHAIADVATGVPSIEAARFLLGRIRAGAVAPEDLARFEEHVARFGDPESDERLIAFARANQREDHALQANQLRAIHRGLQGRGVALGPDGRDWAVALVRSLIGSEDDQLMTLGAELAGEIKLRDLIEPLNQIARAREAPEPRRRQVLSALATIDPAAATETLSAILSQAEESPTLREHAANLLGQNRQEAAREALVQALTTAPARLQVPIAVGLVSDRAGAEKLLEQLEAGKVSPRLLQDRAVEVRLQQANVPDLDRRVKFLTQGLPPADEAIQLLIRKRQVGFADARGQASAGHGSQVFAKICAACHQVDGLGQRIGPQLDGIGARGADRLMEDILDPNRNVDQAFRASTLALDDGRVLTGLVLDDEGGVIVLIDAQGAEVRVPKTSVEDRQIGQLSPMPANLAEQIDEADFYDLIAFLLSSQEAAKPSR